MLKPDLFAVTANGDFEDFWFLEIDRATESPATLIGQCQQYERYRRSGTEQTEHGLFPRVLWLVPDTGRRDQIRAAIKRARDLDRSLFSVELQTELLPALIRTNTKGGDYA